MPEDFAEQAAFDRAADKLTCEGCRATSRQGRAGRVKNSFAIPFPAADRFASILGDGTTDKSTLRRAGLNCRPGKKLWPPLVVFYERHRL